MLLNDKHIYNTNLHEVSSPQGVVCTLGGHVAGAMQVCNCELFTNQQPLLNSITNKAQLLFTPIYGRSMHAGIRPAVRMCVP